jgi:hypothetical protein
MLFATTSQARIFVGGKEVLDSRCSHASSSNVVVNNDNDRRNYYDDSGRRINKQDFIAKYGTSMIDKAGSDERANIHPTYVD